jgi:hypothetical protein
MRARWACGIPSVFTQIYLCFSAAEDFFSAMLDWEGCVCTQFCLWLGLVYFSYCAFYSGSLKLVPRYCNNLYLNSVLFEVRNVFTSLLGLVIVSQLSPKGSGRFSRVAALLIRDLGRSRVIFLALAWGQEIACIQFISEWWWPVDNSPWGCVVYKTENWIRIKVWYRESSVWTY